jgi:putative sigma-54 modulation protein
MDITDAIRSHVYDKLTDELAEFPRVLNVHVILDVQKYRHLAEIVVQASSHISVEGKHESDDMYVSIDGAIDKAAKQLRRRRDKVQDHKARETLAEVEQEVKASFDHNGEQ